MGIFDKAKDLGGQHSDKVEQGVEQGGDVVDEKTDGKYADQVDQGQEQATEFITGGAGGEEKPEDEQR